jgi:uncharacterized protein (DUF952 family)
MTSIYLLAPVADIERAARSGQYAPNSLGTVGFIHCSHAHQVEQIAATVFRDQKNVALLEIDPSRVAAKIIEEASTDSNEAYPHIYGALPMTAVLSVRELKRSQDGAFQMPCTVTGNCACKA